MSNSLLSWSKIDASPVDAGGSDTLFCDEVLFGRFGPSPLKPWKSFIELSSCDLKSTWGAAVADEAEPPVSCGGGGGGGTLEVGMGGGGGGGGGIGAPPGASKC